MGNLLPFDQLDDKGRRKLTALEVAQIAAIFVNGGKTIVEAVGLALEVLDASQWALQYLNPEGYRQGYGYGAKKWLESQAGRALAIKHWASLPKADWKVSANGEVEPLPFDDALALLFPRIKVTDRMPRFREWLAAKNESSSIEAGEEIGRLKETGIDQPLFNWCALTMQDWLGKRIAEKRAASGKKGAVSRAIKKAAKK